MAKKAARKVVTFNLRLSLEAAVDNGAGSVNYYQADWQSALGPDEQEAVVEKLAAVGVPEAEVKLATKAMTAAVKKHK